MTEVKENAVATTLGTPLSFGSDIDPLTAGPAGIYAYQFSQNVTNAYDAQLIDRAELESLNMNMRVAANRGLVRYAFKSDDITTSDINAVRFAIESNNPNLFPKKFSYLAEAYSTVIGDRKATASLNKWIGTFAADAARYQADIEKQRAEELRREEKMAVLYEEANLPGQLLVATKGAMRSSDPTVKYQPHTVATSEIDFFNNSRKRQAVEISNGRDDLAKTIMETAEARVRARADGFGITAVTGLTQQQSYQLDEAIDSRDVSKAPKSSRAALQAIFDLQDATGIDLLSDLGSRVSSWRDGGAKAVADRQEVDSINASAAFDATIQRIPYQDADVAKTVLKTVTDGINNSKMTPAARAEYITAAKGAYARALANNISAMNIPLEQTFEAEAYLRGRSDVNLDPKFMPALDALRAAAEDFGKVDTINSFFGKQMDLYRKEVEAQDKRRIEAINLEKTLLGRNDGTDEKNQLQFQNFLESRALEGTQYGDMYAFFADPQVGQSPVYDTVMNTIRNAATPPSAMMQMFRGLASGDFSIPPQLVLQHWQAIRNDDYAGQTTSHRIINEMDPKLVAKMDALVSMSYLIGSDDQLFALAAGSTPRREDMEVALKQESKNYSSVQAVLSKFVDDYAALPFQLRDNLDDMAVVLWSAYNGSKSGEDIAKQLNGYVAGRFVDGGGIVYDDPLNFGPDNRKTFSPLQFAVGGDNETDFKRYIVDRINSTLTEPTVVGLGGQRVGIQGLGSGSGIKMNTVLVRVSLPSVGQLPPSPYESSRFSETFYYQVFVEDDTKATGLRPHIYTDSEGRRRELIISNNDDDFLKIMADKDADRQAEAIAAGQAAYALQQKRIADNEAEAQRYKDFQSQMFDPSPKVPGGIPAGPEQGPTQPQRFVRRPSGWNVGP